MAPQEDDDDSQHRPDEEGQTPSDVLVEDVRIQEQEVGSSPEGGATPVRAVDGDVDVAAILARDELIDRGVDRGVFSADTQSRDEPEHEQEPDRW